MLKFYRSVLTAGVVALGLAACGDDVTVTNPPPAPPPGVSSVVLAPSSATVGVGQTIQLSASVTADSGVSTQLSWVSSGPLIASVDANGKVTGLAVGTTTVVATSTASPTKSGAVSITVTATPTGITSFTVTPQALTLAVGQSATAIAQVQTSAGTAVPTVTWTSLTPAIATVDQTGKITGVAAGPAVITAMITSGGVDQTVSVAVTVTAVTPASISIASVNQGASGPNSGCPGVVGSPVILSNVACQIDVNLNFNPGNQAVDSIAVYILPSGATSIPAGLPAAAKQSFSNNAATAGNINLSINTAAYGKNTTNATDTTYYTNGPRNLVAAVFVRGQATAPIAGNSNNVVAIVLNNVDGFAADIVKPTNCATNPTTGLTFCGGPSALSGNTTVRLYPVFYTPGRSLSTTTSTVYTIGSAGNASCSSATFFGASAIPVAGTTRQINQGDAKSFGYTAADGGTAQVNCVGYENTFAMRDNVIVTAALDNASNNFVTVGFPNPPPPPPPPAVAPPFTFTTLIANTVVFGSTPDSLRLDYNGPTNVTTPSVSGAEGFNWVNDAVNIRPSATPLVDNGVGVNQTTGYSITLSNGTALPTPCVGILVCNVAGLPETNTNIAPPAGDGYTIIGVGTDLLGNTSNSSTSAVFGVDRTAPVIRYSTSLTDPGTGLYTTGGGINITDSTQYEAIRTQTPGVNDSVRTEALDGRAGLARFITIQRRFSQNGGTGGTTLLTSQNTPCTTPAGTCSSGVPGAATVDGYRAAPAVEITNNQTVPGYYTTVQAAVDRAGNVSSFYKRTIAFDPGQPLVTGVSPISNVAGNQPVAFTIGAQNDLEVIDSKLVLFYPNVTTGNVAGTQSGGLLFPFPTGNNAGATAVNTPLTTTGITGNIFATAFDASIVNPLIATMTLDMYTVSIQETCVGTTPATFGLAAGPTTAPYCTTGGYVGDPIPLAVVDGGIALVQPTNVTVAVRDVFGSFNSFVIGAATTGVSNDFTSNLLPAFLPPTGGFSVTYATIAPGCPTGGGAVGGPCVAGGINFRTDPSLSSASVKTFVGIEPLSTTLPLFTRVELYGLTSGGQWQYIQRIVVPNPISVSASCATNNFVQGVAGCDNGLERQWKYQFTTVPAGFTAYRALGVNPNGYGLFSTSQP